MNFLSAFRGSILVTLLLIVSITLSGCDISSLIKAIGPILSAIGSAMGSTTSTSTDTATASASSPLPISIGSFTSILASPSASVASGASNSSE
ncbi:MAG: hypothetical protein HQM08_23890 [Candidatus Riflebacteria bacterium]|nr:hypothetical protein [Candidatus Riflebacteria bacterium]